MPRRRLRNGGGTTTISGLIHRWEMYRPGPISSRSVGPQEWRILTFDLDQKRGAPQTRTPALRSPPAPPVCGAPPSRSSTTICPGLGLGARGCSRYARNATPPLRSTSSRHSHPHRDRWLQPGWSSPHGSSAPYPRHVVPGGVGVGQGHGEVEAALIHEHRPVRVDLLDPGQVPPPGLWTLFTGVDRLFFSSIPISVPSGTWWLC